MAQIEWLMLANYAEAPPSGGLVYIIGGAWDTLTVGAPLEGAPPNIVAAFTGYLVVRVAFDITETGREHSLRVVLIGVDGDQVAEIAADFRPDRAPGLPASWLQGSNIVVPLMGLGLPRFGEYTFKLNLDGHFMAERPFRVLKGY